MAGADRRHAGAALAFGATLWAGCATEPYSAYPLDLPGGLSTNAFAVCRTVLAAQHGPLVVDDEPAFRLQTGWTACDDVPGERRASVFRSASGGLGVVVELRRLTEPLLGLPHWTAPRGDAAAERELAELLRAALSP